MARIIQFARSYFISVEMILLLICVGIYWWDARPYIWLDGLAQQGPNWLKAGPAGAILLWTFKLTGDVLFPGNDDSVLAKWSEYPMYRSTAMAGVALAFTGAALVFAGVIAQSSLRPGVSSLLGCAGYAMSFAAAFTTWHTSLLVRSMIAGER